MENFISRVTKPKRVIRKKKRKTSTSNQVNVENAKEVNDNLIDTRINKPFDQENPESDSDNTISMQGNLL